MGLPLDLVSYLTSLIGTPETPGVYLGRLDQADLAGHLDSSLTGILALGTPTEAQSRELLRVLTPGAHLLLVAPDEEPTGHTGACILEDTGFEIRDAIFLAQAGSKIHFVPKAARSEREAGCHRLPIKTGFQAVDREEGSAGVENPRAGAGRTATEIRNHHPTVKAKALMERLLEDVPKDQGPVLDPFLGSGSTGIACVATGHDFLGVEREADFIAIADARIRYAEGQRNWAQNSAQIVSDAPTVEPVAPMGLDALFGWE